VNSGAVGSAKGGLIADKSDELAAFRDALVGIKDSAGELDGFKRVNAIVVSEFSYQFGVLGEDVEMEREPAKVEGTTRVEETSEADGVR
jgi:hypothetical protein